MGLGVKVLQHRRSPRRYRPGLAPRNRGPLAVPLMVRHLANAESKERPTGRLFPQLESTRKYGPVGPVRVGKEPPESRRGVHGAGASWPM